jgi:aminoglycoside-2''-adenylyltransferase
VTLGPWEPLTPAEVIGRFDGITEPWWIAGGYAIELFVGRPLRSHGDIDVLLLRRDQALIHHVLPGWDIHAADPPGSLRPWPAGERLPEHVHDIWCRERPEGPWRVQFMLDRSDGDTWICRRDERIRRPIASLRWDGTAALVPEVQLLYKATRSTMPKNEVDFAAALPLLGATQRDWLDNALALTAADHSWRAALAKGSVAG